MLKKPRQIKHSPGVYIFRKGATPIYVGKASHLKSRLGSYFSKAEGRTPKVERMLQEATRLETIETASEIEALIKEAELIKKYRPKYNLLMRDDKSYFYVAITRQPFPRIFITHQPRQKIPNHKSQITNKFKIPSPKYIGPFTSGTALKAVLKLLRRIFPYCTCGQPHHRPCLNAEIGRCVGYCCTIQIQNSKSKFQTYRREYRKNIRNIIAILSGERTRLLGRLKREMRGAVKREHYEEAARLRDAVFGLKDVFAHRRVLHAPEARYPWPIVLGRLQSLLKTERDIRRIEGYDISNISGTSATGSMVVFANGLPDKNQYRKFRIRSVPGISDTAMLKEVLRRRLAHPEWAYPELAVIDGGKGQLNAVLQVLRKFKIQNSKFKIPIVTAMAKREEILFTANGRSTRLREQDPALLYLFQRIRDEAHRFARAYHHKLREKYFAST